MIVFYLYLLAAQARTVESVLPSLTYSRTCSTTIEVHNLGDRAAKARLEPHRESGSLVTVAEQSGMDFELAAGEQKKFTLKLPETTENAWAAVREAVPERGLSPVVAVSGETECAANGRVYDAIREVAHATANPWFDGDVSDLPGGRLVVVNTSETFATVEGCYSGGTLISRGAVLVPLCSYRFHEQIGPFSARQFAVTRGGNTHFSLHTTGARIALQMLRLLDAGTHLFQVDSTISFGQ